MVSSESYGIPAKRYRMHWSEAPILLAKTPRFRYRSTASTMDENRTYVRLENEADSPASLSKLSKKLLEICIKYIS